MSNKKRAVVEELHKPARRNYPRQRVDIRGLDETWQADLVDMTAYAQYNSNTTKMKPKDVNIANEERLLHSVYNRIEVVKKRAKFKIGDKVRINYQDEVIAGGFYEHELLKVKYPDIYLIEKVVKRRGNKIFVKWLGFDDSQNSWIDAGAIK
ncbi:uncharacterized protein [Venturia canescens]|uniref:uncharacterized protein n=1 Tax=Venturia canescens TaxID=32260 RepID=UPI001C9BFF38|nr:uncharacterized protein LOC122411408 [Venturia canescens]